MESEVKKLDLFFLVDDPLYKKLVSGSEKYFRAVKDDFSQDDLIKAFIFSSLRKYFSL